MRRLILLVTVLGSTLSGVPLAHGDTATIEAVPVVDSDNAFVTFTFFPDGRIVYGERYTGKIYVFDPDSGQKTLFFTVSLVSRGTERGLLGLAVHPQYPVKPFLYIYVTRSRGEESRNQILRIRDSAGVGTSPKVIWESDVPSDIAHNGGRILFGPDGMLYFVIGDALEPTYSQDPTKDPGKVHRITEKGAVPADNPFPGSTIWSYGHRNHFGFDFDPLTLNLWQGENGPECNDEINRIVKGANYGWGPSATCSTPPPPPENTNQDGPNPVLPESWFTPTVAPVGVAFCNGCGLADSEGTMLVGFSNGATIQRVVLTPDRLHVESVSEIYDHDVYSVISLEAAPDGTIYFDDFGTIYKLVEA